MEAVLHIRMWLVLWMAHVWGPVPGAAQHTVPKPPGAVTDTNGPRPPQPRHNPAVQHLPEPPRQLLRPRHSPRGAADAPGVQPPHRPVSRARPAGCRYRAAGHGGYGPGRHSSQARSPPRGSPRAPRPHVRPAPPSPPARRSGAATGSAPAGPAPVPAIPRGSAPPCSAPAAVRSAPLPPSTRYRAGWGRGRGRRSGAGRRPGRARLCGHRPCGARSLRRQRRGGTRGVPGPGPGLGPRAARAPGEARQPRPGAGGPAAGDAGAGRGPRGRSGAVQGAPRPGPAAGRGPRGGSGAAVAGARSRAGRAGPRCPGVRAPSTPPPVRGARPRCAPPVSSLSAPPRSRSYAERPATREPVTAPPSAPCQAPCPGHPHPGGWWHRAPSKPLAAPRVLVTPGTEQAAGCHGRGLRETQPHRGRWRGVQPREIKP